MAGSIQISFASLLERLNNGILEGLNASIQLEILGDEGGVWHARFADGTASVAKGIAALPDISLSVLATDWVDIVNGKLTSQFAFLVGRISFSGDVTLALRLQDALSI